MNKATVIGILLLVAFFGCEKVKSPENVIGNAVFYLEGELGSEAFKMVAGDEGYYMNTETGKDTLEVSVFEGVLGNIKCVDASSCPLSIKVLFRDVRSHPQESYIDEALTIGDYIYRAPADSVLAFYKVAFTSHIMGSGDFTYSWDFGDGSPPSTDANPVHYYAPVYQWVEICLSITDNQSGCTSSICNEINLPAYCSTSFTYQFNGPNFGLSAHPDGQPPFVNLWDLGLGFKPLSDYAGYTFPPGVPYVKMCLETTDANNCVSRSCQNAVVDSTLLYCMANFEYDKTNILARDEHDFNQVTIIWEDESGNSYRSDRFDQPEWNKMEVLEVSEYEEDTKGNPTKKIHIRVNCRLFGDSPNVYVDLLNTEGIFAVAYPKN